MILGIDIGTTKVAAVIIDTQGQLLTVCSRPHAAELETLPGHAEQNANVLLSVARSVVLELPEQFRAAIEAVGVTGQMHGVAVLDENNQPVTPLITWQDTRCLENDFLNDLRLRTGHNISSGFGCATLAWLTAMDLLPSSATSASTIHDLLVAQLCGLDKPLTDPTDAASWGLFDLYTLNWDFNAVKTAGLSAELLPEVVPCSRKAGTICKAMAEEFGIPAGIPIAAALGDNQASLLATLSDPEEELALTLGTGGQLSAVLPASHELKPLEADSKYEYRPFPGSRFTMVASSLCGGSAWSWLVDTVEKWLQDLNFTPPSRDELYEHLNNLGLGATDTLEVHPYFLAERYDTSLRGSIHGIGLSNFDLGTLSRALAQGIIENLKNMLPEDALRQRSRVVGSGNALRRTPLLQLMAGDVFNLPLNIEDLQEEAACGAALNAVALI